MNILSIYVLIKKLFDIAISASIIIVTSPILIGSMVLIYIYMGSPILFIQNRPGKNGIVFPFFKFRTMTQEKDTKGALLPDKYRLTRIGKFLRKTSIDELPSMWNVLRGDMSIVGPRPLLMEYLGRYSKEQARRHETKPGITGWAQVNGRNTISWEEKFKLDVWYVDNKSFWLDIKILLMSIWKVLNGEGISQPGHVTMEKFRGND